MGVSENSQQQGPPGEKREVAWDSSGERARNKIKGVVQSNAIAGLDVDAPDTTEGSGEDLEKYSKGEGNEAKLGVAEARRENTDKLELITTTHIHEANKKGNESENESEEEEGITEVEPGKPKPAGEGL